MESGKRSRFRPLSRGTPSVCGYEINHPPLESIPVWNATRLLLFECLKKEPIRKILQEREAKRPILTQTDPHVSPVLRCHPPPRPPRKTLKNMKRRKEYREKQKQENASKNSVTTPPPPQRFPCLSLSTDLFVSSRLSPPRLYYDSDDQCHGIRCLFAAFSGRKSLASSATCSTACPLFCFCFWLSLSRGALWERRCLESAKFP